MIHRISVTVTQHGLQLNATDTAGDALQQIWVPTQAGVATAFRASALAHWRLNEPLERLAQSLLPLAARLTRSLRQGSLPGMQSLTFDIGPGWVDCHVMMTSFEEVVLRYPLATEAACEQMILPLIPVVQAGSLEALPDAFLKTFHQAVKTRFWLLAQQLKQQTRVVRSVAATSTEDAA